MITKTRNQEPIQVSGSDEIADFYNTMAAGNDYDALWAYDEAYYDQLHRILLSNLERIGNSEGRVLDIGCGSGAQTVLLCKRGYQVYGVDISEELLKICETKTSKFQNKPVLKKADAVSLPFDDGYFDYIVCFYNVLNHILTYQQAIKEMRRVLKIGGYIFLEIEKASISDLIFGGLDLLLGGRLGYEATLSDWLRQLRKPFGTYIAELPYKSKSIYYWRFSPKDVEREFKRFNLRTVRKYGISITGSTIPWGFLQRDSPVIRSISSFLRRIDYKLSGLPGFRNFGLSTLYILRRV